MVEARVAGIAGLVFGLAALPVLHFVAVDLERKTAPGTFLADVNDHWVRIALSGGVGLLLAAALMLHLVALRRVAGGRRALLADAGVAVSFLAALGVALSSAAAIMAAYGAHEDFPFEAVRPMGLIAENLVAVLMPTLAGSALLVSVLALKERALRRWLGFVAGFFAVVLTALGVLLPGAGLVPSIAWVLVASVSLLTAHEVREAVPQS